MSWTTVLSAGKDWEKGAGGRCPTRVDGMVTCKSRGHGIYTWQRPRKVCYNRAQMSQIIYLTASTPVPTMAFRTCHCETHSDGVPEALDKPATRIPEKG